MIALDTAITWLGVREAIGQAWSWWASELLQAVPPSIRNRFVHPRPEFLIQFGPESAVIARTDGTFRDCQTSIEWTSEDAKREIARAIPLFQTAARPKVVVCLSSSMVLKRELELPRSAEPRVKEIVALDLDRLTPFTLENATFDVVVQGRNLDSGHIQVALAVAPRKTLDAALSLCRSLGVSPHSVIVEDSETLSHEFNLLPRQRGNVGPRSWKQPSVVLGAAIVVLVVTNIFLGFWRMDVRLSQLSAELARVRKDAQATEKLRDQLTRSEAEARLLSESRAQLGPLEVLDRVTHLLPDDVWLFQFELRDGVVRIAGLAPSAADLIDRLEKAEEFANPKFKAPVTRADNKSGADRFEIGFGRRPRNSR